MAVLGTTWASQLVPLLVQLLQPLLITPQVLPQVSPLVIVSVESIRKYLNIFEDLCHRIYSYSYSVYDNIRIIFAFQLTWKYNLTALKPVYKEDKNQSVAVLGIPTSTTPNTTPRTSTTPSTTHRITKSTTPSTTPTTNPNNAPNTTPSTTSITTTKHPRLHDAVFMCTGVGGGGYPGVVGAQNRNFCGFPMDTFSFSSTSYLLSSSSSLSALNVFKNIRTHLNIFTIEYIRIHIRLIFSNRIYSYSCSVFFVLSKTYQTEA